MSDTDTHIQTFALVHVAQAGPHIITELFGTLGGEIDATTWGMETFEDDPLHWAQKIKSPVEV